MHGRENTDAAVVGDGAEEEEDALGAAMTLQGLDESGVGGGGGGGWEMMDASVHWQVCRTQETRSIALSCSVFGF